MAIIVNKKKGETPLECLERVRLAEKIDPKTPMTYAGRLDPMAEGVLIILVGEECKNKEKYLGLDKEYEVEIVFGIATDTFDALGIIASVKNEDLVKNNEKFVTFSSYVGKHIQAYPAYSSKTVNGKQLHEYARAGELPNEIPTKEVEIYSIQKLEEKEITGREITEQVIKDIKLVKGDFRQEEIIKGWENFAEKYSNKKFKIVKVKVACSSGTYMRSLANRVGKDAGTGAIALLIKRISVGEYKII